MLSVFAGRRPLVRRGRGRDTSVLSRDHTILVSASGLITLTGGKWTTYRKMAEDVIDHAERLADFAHRACSTAELALHGATAPKPPAAELADYGSDAADISALARAEPVLGNRVHPLRNIYPVDVAGISNRPGKLDQRMACPIPNL